MRYADALRGGHPNSLGATVEVVEHVLADPRRVDVLLDAYADDDPVVRLRIASAVKRVAAARPEWVQERMDRVLDVLPSAGQPSGQWTLAQLVGRADLVLTAAQRRRAVGLLQGFLSSATDWIVLMASMQTLADWAQRDADLRAWLAPQLDRLARDPRRSVRGRARKLRDGLAASAT